MPFSTCQELTKLPPVLIPVYTGKCREWSHWIVQAMIKKNRSLDNIQKLWYLLGYLKGATKDAVVHFDLRSTICDAALTILGSGLEALDEQNCNIWTRSLTLKSWLQVCKRRGVNLQYYSQLSVKLRILRNSSCVSWENSTTRPYATLKNPSHLHKLFHSLRGLNWFRTPKIFYEIESH